MNDTLLIQLARDAFQRQFSRTLNVAKREDVCWTHGYIACLKETVADRTADMPGLIAVLLDMNGDLAAEVEELKGKVG